MTINSGFYDKLQTAIEKEGVHVLFNEIINLDDDIQVIGLDDMCLSAEDGSLAVLMEKIDMSKASVLLAHEPQELNWYAQCGVDLVFSGHAHGGQIRIPFLNIGLVAPDQGFFPKYTSGIFQKSNTQMIVSRGLGNSILPFRIFNRPEIVEVNMH